MDKLDWEPSYGFCKLNTTDNIRLAEALEVVRRRICAYNMGLRDGDTACDCKYGANLEEKSFGSERTGCPELREMINRLLHRPESFDQ